MAHYGDTKTHDVAFTILDDLYAYKQPARQNGQRRNTVSCFSPFHPARLFRLSSFALLLCFARSGLLSFAAPLLPFSSFLTLRFVSLRKHDTPKTTNAIHPSIHSCMHPVLSTRTESRMNQNPERPKKKADQETRTTFRIRVCIFIATKRKTLYQNFDLFYHCRCYYHH